MHSRELRKKVRILNPIENGNGANITSRKKANEYVSQGRAVFAGRDFIRFIESDARNQTTMAVAAACYARATERTCSKIEVASVPFVRPAFALQQILTDRTKVRVRRSPAGISGRVNTLVSGGIATWMRPKS